MADRRKKQKRRTNRDRRSWRSRRQMSDERLLVIELMAEELCVVELRRGDENQPDLLKSAKYRWRKEATSLQSELGLQELTVALREVARCHAWQAGAVHLVLSGQFCVTRAIRGANEEVRAELQRLSLRSRLYLSLGPGEKVMVSNTQVLDARHQHALAAVCNEKTLTTIQLAAETAGLQIASIEPALSAASRAVSRIPDVPQAPYLLIHLDEGSPDIGVCHRGQLLLDYRPGGRATAEQLPTLLAEHLNRLQRHTARKLRAEAPELRRVYLCGCDAAVAAALESFANEELFQAKRAIAREVQATWEFAEGAENFATTPALGVLLASYLPESESDAPNLMEHIIASTREPLRPILIRSALPLAAVLLVGAILALLNLRKQTEIDGLQAELAQLAPVQARATELRLQLVRAGSKLKQLEQVASQLTSPIGGEVVQRLGNCLPGDVWLNQLILSDGQSVRVQGSSFLEAGVYDFVRWLEQAPGFTEVALKATRPASSETGPVTSFDLELQASNLTDQIKKVASNE